MTLATVLVLVSGTEGYWRSCGHRPSINDGPEYWSIQRARVADDNPKHVVVLGASRIQADFSTDFFRKRYPDYALTQLAIAGGTSSLAVLRDLANDQKFRGVVICSITAAWIADESERQQQYVEFFNDSHRISSNSINTFISTFFQSELVILSPRVRWLRLLRSSYSGVKLPNPEVWVIQFDRSVHADFSLSNIEKLRTRNRERMTELRNEEPPRLDIWTEVLSRVQKDVQKIRSRGGQVVFVRLPTGGEQYRIEEAACPKAVYWDRIADLTSAVTVHFTDIPSMTQFELPDHSHMDMTETAHFTESLFNVLEDREIVRRR